MADGTFVVVTAAEPLPAVVQADANARATAAVVANPVAASNEAYDARARTASDVAVGTGKRVIIVWLVNGYPTSMAETTSNFWSVTGIGESCSGILRKPRRGAVSVIP